MKKVTILALHLGFGGIEKAITNLANILVGNYEVEIISTYKLYDKPVNELNNKVNVKYLSNLKPNKNDFFNALKKLNIIKTIKEGFISLKILYLKRILMIKYIKNSKSDIIISTRDIHNKWLGKYAKKNVLKIGWEHNHHHGNKKYVKKIVKSVKNLNYFVLVSKDLKDFYQKQINVKCIYIPNFIIKGQVVSKLDQNNIVSIGRLVPEKGFLDLVDIFKKIADTYPKWHLFIVGDGLQFNKLKEKIKLFNLENNVILTGYKKKDEIDEILEKSSIYVMTSYTESFGIVLLEAMNYGIPCIAYTSAEGANEIITNNVDGYLIKNRDENLMIKKIKNLICDMDERKKLGKNARKKIDQYSETVVKEKWLEIMK